MRDGKCQISSTNGGVAQISNKRLYSHQATRGQKPADSRGLCGELETIPMVYAEAELV